MSSGVAERSSLSGGPVTGGSSVRGRLQTFRRRGRRVPIRPGSGWATAADGTGQTWIVPRGHIAWPPALADGASQGVPTGLAELKFTVLQQTR